MYNDSYDSIYNEEIEENNNYDVGDFLLFLLRKEVEIQRKTKEKKE